MARMIIGTLGERIIIIRRTMTIGLPQLSCIVL